MAKVEFLYSRLYDRIRQGILDGKYLPSSKLPTEAELRKEYEVSSITVKKALTLLSEDGMLRRVPGKGTFVMDQLEEKSRNVQPQLNSTHLIGVVFEHISTPFGLDMMYRMDQAAEKAGYKLCIRFSYADREKETAEINFLRSLNAEGIIIMPSHGSHYNTAILELIIEKYPTVLIDKKLEGIPVPSVRTDNENAMAGLVRCLAEDGCKHIALATIEEFGATSLKERKIGFYYELAVLGLPCCPECVLDFTGDIVENAPVPSTVKVFTEFLKAEKGTIDGIVCSEYGLIPAFMQAAKETGIMPGKDIKVCCIDEDYLAPYGFCFTHAKQDEIKIAETAVALLVTLMKGEEVLSEDYKIPALIQKGTL